MRQYVLQESSIPQDYEVHPLFDAVAFAGTLPMIKGLTSLVFGRQRLAASVPPQVGGATDPAPGRANAERQILMVAKEEQGWVTPALAALKTDISIDNAERILQSMAEKGHATMHVTDEGRVEYRFPEFAPRLDDGATKT